MTKREKEIVKALRKDFPLKNKKYAYNTQYKIGDLITGKLKLDEMVRKGTLIIGEHHLLGNSHTYTVNEEVW